jgi:hypothetical protein
MSGSESSMPHLVDNDTVRILGKSTPAKEELMASKSPVNEATRHLIWAYGAGVITGLALFGAGSFYIGMLTR